MRIFLEVKGGLGNQLFYWAAARYLEQELALDSKSIILDVRSLDRPNSRPYDLGFLSSFPLRSSVIGEKGWRLVPRNARFNEKLAARWPMPRPSSDCIVTNSYSETLANLHLGRSVWVRSYLQEPEYIDKVQNVRSILQNALLKSVRTRAIAEALATSEPYAAAHVRRGDYLASADTLKALGACDATYYISAIKALEVEGTLRIATDDPTWVQWELAPRIGRPIEILSNSDPLIDFAWLVFANQLVLSNSTFSWWAAYAGLAKRTIAPRPWFNALGGGDRLRLTPWESMPRNEVVHN